MKTLVCCLETPWPPMSGIQLRCWQMIKLLRAVSDVCVFALTGRTEPPPQFSARTWRTPVAGPQQKPAASWMSRPGGLPSDDYYDARCATAVREVLREFAPDVVVLETLWMHRYFEDAREHGARVVLDAHNVEADVADQFEKRETFGPAKLHRKMFAQRVRSLEAEFSNRVDQIWACSLEDRSRFVEGYNCSARVYVVPNATDPLQYRERQPRPRELEETASPVLLFTAEFRYPPNTRAADFLIQRLFPKIVERHPNAMLILAGGNPTPAMLAAAETERRIVVTGRVADMLPYLQHASVMLVPLTEGGGTRFKIIEAFAAHLPVASSRKGAEGLGAVPGTHFLLAEEVDQFVDAIETILREPDVREPTIRSAADLAQELYDRAGTAVGEAIAGLQQL